MGCEIIYFIYWNSYSVNLLKEAISLFVILQIVGWQVNLQEFICFCKIHEHVGFRKQ